MTVSFTICHVHGCCIGRDRVEVDPELLEAARSRLGVQDASEVIAEALRCVVAGATDAARRDEPTGIDRPGSASAPPRLR
jgi:Arc/MetJ family transcription regulator